MGVPVTTLQAYSDPMNNTLEKEENNNIEKVEKEDTIDRSIEARQRILNVAIKMFSSNGYDGVSTTQIAKASGVTQPLIHYHFKSKFSLWKACVSQAFQWLDAEFIQQIKSSNCEQPKEKVEMVIMKFVAFAASRPEFSRFLLSEGSQESDRLTWMVSEYVRPLTQEFEKMYNEGVESQLLKKMPVSQLVSIIMGAATQFYAWKPMLESTWSINPEDPEQANIQQEVVVEFIKNAVLA